MSRDTPMIPAFFSGLSSGKQGADDFGHANNKNENMVRKRLTNSQVVCLTLLWGVLCYMLLAYSKEITGQTVFWIIASGIIVFVPIYKNIKGRNGDKS